ncbi:MAG: response regulator [Candidatus Methylomirabilales bacterium]
MEDAIRVLLVDDHAIFRKGLASLLLERTEFEVLAEAENGREAVEKAREYLPDLILMDIYMPEMDGLEATRQIKEEMPTTKIVMLTVSEEDHNLFEAIKGGAEGYLIKDVKPQELFEMLRGVSRGDAPLSRPIATKILKGFAREIHRKRGPARGPSITLREQEVLEQVARGHANKEIAAALGISESTVKKHLRNILEKLHLENRVEAAIYALKEGLVSESPAAGTQKE